MSTLFLVLFLRKLGKVLGTILRIYKTCSLTLKRKGPPHMSAHHILFVFGRRLRQVRSWMYNVYHLTWIHQLTKDVFAQNTSKNALVVKYLKAILRGYKHVNMRCRFFFLSSSEWHCTAMLKTRGRLVCYTAVLCVVAQRSLWRVAWSHVSQIACEKTLRYGEWG